MKDKKGLCVRHFCEFGQPQEIQICYECFEKGLPSQAQELLEAAVKEGIIEVTHDFPWTEPCYDCGALSSNDKELD